MHPSLREEKPGDARNPARFLVFSERRWGDTHKIVLKFHGEESLARARDRVEGDPALSGLAGMDMIAAYFAHARAGMFGAHCLKNGRLEDHPVGLPGEMEFDGDGDLCRAASFRAGKKVHDLPQEEILKVDAGLKAGRVENTPPLTLKYLAGYIASFVARPEKPSEKAPRVQMASRSTCAWLMVMTGEGAQVGPRPADLPAARSWPKLGPAFGRRQAALPAAAQAASGQKLGR